MLSEGTAAERERVVVNSISHSHCNQMQQLKREAIHSADDFLLPADVDPHVRGASLVRKRPSSVCCWSADSMSLVTRLMRLRKKKTRPTCDTTVAESRRSVECVVGCFFVSL